MFFVPRINRGGGLALYWWSLIDVNVDNFSKNHIDAIMPLLIRGRMMIGDLLVFMGNL